MSIRLLASGMRHLLAKGFCLAAATIFGATTIAAQESVITDWDPKVNVSFDTRVDWNASQLEGEHTRSGFHGRYLNVMVNGQLNSQLSFSLRQRLNKFQQAGNNVFNATDWIYLMWRPSQSFSLQGGKQVVLIGGFEYDAPPIDIYYASMFWNNVACYQMGVSTTYYTPDNNNAITFQVCNSPLNGIGSGHYAYNLYWSGKLNRLSTLWSANLIEMEHHKMATYIALGNRLNFDGGYFQVDIMNRYTHYTKFWFGNYTVIGKLSVDLSNKFTMFAKGGYEKYCSEPGVSGLTIDKPYYGAGLEFYPIPTRKKNLRLHLVADMNHGADGQRCYEVMAGVKFLVDLFSSK